MRNPRKRAYDDPYFETVARRNRSLLAAEHSRHETELGERMAEIGSMKPIKRGRK